METIKIILNKTKSINDRYYLINGSMGCAGTPKNHANNFVEVANGVDRGNGYSGYIAVSYFLTQEHVPQEAKDKVVEFCKKHNYVYN